jgi:DNA-binding transcriptional MerR regulator
MTSPERTYTIRELSREFVLTARAIRFYEDRGLLTPARTGQARVFSHRDRVRLSFVVRGKRVGFSLADIKEMLDLYDLAGPRAQLGVSIGKFRARIAELEAQRDEIDLAIAELKKATLSAESFLLQDPEGARVDLIGYGLKSNDNVTAG